MRHILAPALLPALLLAIPALAQPDGLAPRQHIYFNDGWRFHPGDPDGNSAPYLYDVRPEMQQSADGKVADAIPEDAARVAERAAFKGLVLGIVRARPGTGGAIRVRVEAEGLAPATLTISATRG